MRTFQFADNIKSDLRYKECYIHNFKTQSDLELDVHFNSLPHYVKGTNGECENCHENVPEFLVPYKTMAEPAHIFCDNCKKGMDLFLETLQGTKFFNSCFHKENQ